MERVLSGMQPSGKLHLGNLVGALQNWVRLQQTYDCYYFIADWHALTTGYADTSGLQESVQDLLVNFLAAGLDPDRCTIFIQSRLPEHAELHLLLSMITPLGWLERVPTYKEKQQELKDRDLATYGFLGYPLLQTADIIIYRAKYVPVGIDQVPHLEISREIARRFNYLYREVFPEPRRCRPGGGGDARRTAGWYRDGGSPQLRLECRWSARQPYWSVWPLSSGQRCCSG